MGPAKHDTLSCLPFAHAKRALWPENCMQDSFARARTRPKGQARATIGYLVYKPEKSYTNKDIISAASIPREILGAYIDAFVPRVRCMQQDPE